MFLAPWFAVAGLIAAVGPILIHLLNRRRYRTVPWAAMDFLREAVLRSRRILQLRDLLLLALRTLCIVAFGAAMARPFLSSSSVLDPDQPVHAVLLVDNSLSMGYRQLDGTLLDEAKVKAKELIDGLPRGSRISVVPTCGSAAGVSPVAYYTKDDALEALGSIEPVDRATLPHETIDLALEACRRVPTLAAKEIVLLSNQQAANWSSQSLADHLRQLPSPIKVLEVRPAMIENGWVADFRLRDGVADLQTPAVFVATLQYEGTDPQPDVRVDLIVDGVTTATQTVDLQPDQAREVEFPPCQLDVPVQQGRPTYVTAEVAISGQRDHLPADDRRFVVVPVVATLPVVFVDQWGQDEEPRRNRYGETFHLRRLLAPITNRAQRQRQLVEVRHVRIDQLDRSLLEDARLVVVAGVSNPEGAVPLLREYVEQGGNLVLAAGADFDPGAWNDAAWQEGLGILPAPLKAVTVGRLPEESPAEPKFFQLDFNSLKDHEYFAVEATSIEELQDLYRLPYFFKAVAADTSDAVRDNMLSIAAKHLEQRRRTLADINQRMAELDALDAQQKLSPAQRQQRADLERERSRLKPAWLLWAAADQAADDARPVEQLAVETKPSVLARYTNGLPFMVQRRIGRGKVLLVTSGVHAGWNTLSVTNAVLLFDRILRGMLQQTLPERNISSQRPFVLPLPAAERGAGFALVDPDGQQRPLAAGALGADRYGVIVGDFARRGAYRIVASRGKDAPQDSLDAKLWEVTLAVNGPPEASQLVSPEESRLRRERGQGVSLETAQAVVLGGVQWAQVQTELWKWGVLVVFLCLLMELTVLAWPVLRGERNR